MTKTKQLFYSTHPQKELRYVEDLLGHVTGKSEGGIERQLYVALVTAAILLWGEKRGFFAHLASLALQLLRSIFSSICSIPTFIRLIRLHHLVRVVCKFVGEV